MKKLKIRKIMGESSDCRWGAVFDGSHCRVVHCGDREIEGQGAAQKTKIKLAKNRRRQRGSGRKVRVRAGNSVIAAQAIVEYICDGGILNR
jgi:hypothetical protein